MGALRCLRQRNFSPSKKGTDHTKHGEEKMQNDFAMNDTYSRCAAVHSFPPSHGRGTRNGVPVRPQPLSGVVFARNFAHRPLGLRRCSVRGVRGSLGGLGAG